MNPYHLIDLNDYNLSFWEDVFALSKKIKQNPENYHNKLQNKIMATLFFEPSTRTMLSFQSAFLKLGGKIIGFDSPNSSSVSKGEDISDTVRTVGKYCDIIVMRHSLEGSCKYASEFSEVPLINAGDGKHLHPTQTLTDMMTIYSEFGKLDGLKIGVCGDLKNGRTVHSLIKGLSQYDNKFFLISTPKLTIPNYIKDFMMDMNIEFKEIYSISECIDQIDVLYMTRIQRERFENEQEYINQKDVYILTEDKLKNANPNLKIMHPLPRVDEISRELDKRDNAIYFKQIEYGLYARMALLILLLDKDLSKSHKQFEKTVNSKTKCTNKTCISNNEKSCTTKIKNQNNQKVCYYCEKAI